MERTDALRLLQLQCDIASLATSIPRLHQHTINETQAASASILSKTSESQGLLFNATYEPILTSATAEVFATFGLLEAISLELWDLNDIFSAAQVCRYWQQVIEQSSRLQVANGYVLIWRSNGVELSLFVHASFKLPMRILPSKLKRVHCDPSHGRGGIDWHDSWGELVCSKAFNLLNCHLLLDPIRWGAAYNEPLKAYLDTFHWRLDFNSLRHEWLVSQGGTPFPDRQVEEYDERKAVEALKIWIARVACDGLELLDDEETA